MKNWTDYFLNESHIEGKENQIEWICKQLKKLDDKQVKKVYEFMEKEFDLEDK